MDALVTELMEVRGRAKQILDDLDELIATTWVESLDRDRREQVELARFQAAVVDLGDGFRVEDGKLVYSAAWLGEKAA